MYFPSVYPVAYSRESPLVLLMRNVYCQTRNTNTVFSNTNLKAHSCLHVCILLPFVQRQGSRQHNASSGGEWPQRQHIFSDSFLTHFILPSTSQQMVSPLFLQSSHRLSSFYHLFVMSSHLPSLISVTFFVYFTRGTIRIVSLLQK